MIVFGRNSQSTLTRSCGTNCGYALANAFTYASVSSPKVFCNCSFACSSVISLSYCSRCNSLNVVPISTGIPSDSFANAGWNGCCNSTSPSGVGPKPHIIGVPGFRVPMLAAIAFCPASYSC